MQCYPVWSSSRGTRGELLQTEPIWRPPPWDSLSCGREGHINLFHSCHIHHPACQALLNKSVFSLRTCARGIWKRSGSADGDERVRREESWRAKWEWEGINGREGKYQSAVRGERESLCKRTSKAQDWVVLFTVAANRLTERHSLHFNWREHYLKGVFSKTLAKPPYIIHPELSIATVSVQ